MTTYLQQLVVYFKTVDAQIATALVILGAWIGCLNGTVPSDLYGRKFVMMFNTVFFLVGALLSAGNKITFFIGRFISGIGVGISSVLGPILLSEMATAGNRGMITTLHQMFLTVAILFASIFAYFLVGQVRHGWRYVQVSIPITAHCLLRLWLIH